MWVWQVGKLKEALAQKEEELTELQMLHMQAPDLEDLLSQLADLQRDVDRMDEVLP